MPSRYYGEKRGHRDCPCCGDGQTPQTAKKTARQSARKEIDTELLELTQAKEKE